MWKSSFFHNASGTSLTVLQEMLPRDDAEVASGGLPMGARMLKGRLITSFVSHKPVKASSIRQRRCSSFIFRSYQGKTPLREAKRLPCERLGHQRHYLVSSKWAISVARDIEIARFTLGDAPTWPLMRSNTQITHRFAIGTSHTC